MHLIEEGGDYANYDVDDRLIVRIPHDPIWAQGMRVERELLPRLRPRLPVTIPVFEYVAEPDGRFPYGLAVYRKIHGVSGESRRPIGTGREHCADRLGRTLSELHSFNLQEARGCGVPVIREPSPDTVMANISRYAELIRRDAPKVLTAEAERYLSGSVTLPPVSTLDAVLLHHDLKGEHFLLNERAEDIVGIIDWADASIGDPATDFVGVALWLGMPFVEQVLQYYDRPIDRGFIERVRFNNQAMRLIHLGKTLAGEWDAPLDLIMTQFRWAFGLEE